MSHRKSWTILIVIILLIAGVSIILFLKSSSSNAPQGYKKVKDFQYAEPSASTCLALSAECGYCSGEIINKECYIKE
jgi:flagellar basal body-associated protein FliL